MLQKLRGNSKGFTLIELMIVIAIIGILAAIAIPNFIEYRDKAYCSAAESDLEAVLAAVSDYFSDPNNVSVSDGTIKAAYPEAELSYGNTYTLTDETTNTYRIVVSDATERCPRFRTTSEVF